MLVKPGKISLEEETGYQNMRKSREKGGEGEENKEKAWHSKQEQYIRMEENMA